MHLIFPRSKLFQTLWRQHQHFHHALKICSDRARARKRAVVLQTSLIQSIRLDLVHPVQQNVRLWTRSRLLIQPTVVGQSFQIKIASCLTGATKVLVKLFGRSHQNLRWWRWKLIPLLDSRRLWWASTKNNEELQSITNFPRKMERPIMKMWSNLASRLGFFQKAALLSAAQLMKSQWLREKKRALA